ncbi:hypothetical protein IQ255_29550 [Pleurocapsales cyanobacterium LEGE 10410]|nr:hypothetical protein [Pleurocapsales cyanobacterium LEGE 10410]
MRDLAKRGSKANRLHQFYLRYSVLFQAERSLIQNSFLAPPCLVAIEGD